LTAATWIQPRQCLCVENEGATASTTNVSMQVSPTFYNLHIQRQRPRVKNSASAISPAGGGMGLQVFPGSIQEVDCVSEGWIWLASTVGGARLGSKWWRCCCQGLLSRALDH